ncbi:MAG TPA: copper resistance protein CopC [Streptosporangiaceae bacterium]
MRSLRAVLLVTVLALAWVGVLASPAEAHALLERSYPAAGASLSRAPHAMLLYFTEPPEPGLSTLSLLDSSGQIVPGVGTPAAVPGDAQELRATLPTLTDGVYTVNWRTVSKVDGHVTGGSFAFRIGIQPSSGSAGTGAANGGPLSTGSTPAPAAVAGLWLLYWGLALLAAAGATGVLVFGWRLPGQAREVIAAGWLSAAVGILTMIFSEQAAAGVPFGELFRAATGRSLLAQAAAVAVCGVAAFYAARRTAGPRLAVLGAAAAGALFVHAQAGHAETRSPVRLLNVTDQWLHMLAAGVWAGGLVWLLLGLRGLDGPARASAVRRFSQLAFAAVAVIAVTGVLRAVPEVGSLGALTSTSFGVALLVKTGLFLALTGIAWRNRYRLAPRIARSAPTAAGRLSAAMGGAAADPPAPGEAGAKRRVAGAVGSLQRSVRSEVALAAIVLLVAAVLSGLPPASSVEAAGQTTASPSVIATGSDFATTARVRLTASPGTVGPNRFQVQVLRYDANSPLPARSVRLEFSLPSNPNVASSLSLARSAGGTWTGQGTNLSIDGQWDIDVVVQETATAVDVPLRLRTRLPPEQITVSMQPGQPTLYTIQLAHGRSLQMYLQQIDPGHGVVHFTFFQTPEREESITSARATAITPGGADQPLKVIRFGKGHLAANVKLIPGRWTFRIDAVPAGGPPLSGYFSQPVRP